jgi:hypothetical protein
VEKKGASRQASIRLALSWPKRPRETDKQQLPGILVGGQFPGVCTPFMLLHFLLRLIPRRHVPSCELATRELVQSDVSRPTQ